MNKFMYSNLKLFNSNINKRLFNSNINKRLFNSNINKRLFNSNINKRLFNTNNSNIIKSLYPKCINCVSFDKNNNTCKKIQIDSEQNYVNHSITYEQAAIVRNNDDEDTCGETGKFFEHNYEKLSKENEPNLHISIFFGGLSGIAVIVITEPIICFIPMFVTLIHSFIYFINYYEIKNSIKYDNERLKKLNKLLENNNII
jgi:hypothetical protein